MSLSLSHQITPAEVLEHLAVPSEQRGRVLARLHAMPCIDEVVVLSTCDRIEVYVATRGPAGQVIRAIADLIARGLVPVHEILRMARTRVGAPAAEHLFSVACGLDSTAVGEDQIKGAARAAAAAGTIGPVITGLIDAALRDAELDRLLHRGAGAAASDTARDASAMSSMPMG